MQLYPKLRPRPESRAELGGIRSTKNVLQPRKFPVREHYRWGGWDLNP